MPPKKKLSKKEKARQEAEQAELLRIEMEKEKQKKLEEERQRREIEREQAKKRQQEEIAENKVRRQQLKDSMAFFNDIQDTISAIKQNDKEQRDWEKFMRCNGLPNASSPSDLRKYIHQWRADIEQRQEKSRNWLLKTDERTLLTQDSNIADLTSAALKRQQGNLGDIYARRAQEILGIFEELEEALQDRTLPKHTLVDLKRLKSEIRVILNDYLDDFTYKTMSHIERDMEIDRPGVSRLGYTSEIFKSLTWTFSKDAQLAVNPKARIGEQNQHTEIDFPIIELQITLPPNVELRSSALRGQWLNYDHFSDYCPSFNLKRPRLEHMNLLIQTKIEWRKRKEILQNMLDECSKEIEPSSIAHMNHEHSSSSQPPVESAVDVDKLYTEYEDQLNKARRRVIGPEGFGLLETDVNLRKYRIIGGIYSVDYLETPQQDKRLNARSFIRTIFYPDCLQRKVFYQTYKPPPPVQPGVRRLPEEIEAEMRLIEAALDKLALVTLQLPNSVIWFEPPIACRWETNLESFDADQAEGITVPTVDTDGPPTEVTQTPRSTTNTLTNISPLKSSPRSPAKFRKRSSQKSSNAQPQAENELPVREVTDFDMFNIPCGIDIHGLLKDFVVPRLPAGFCVRMDVANAAEKPIKKQPTVMYLARHKSVDICRARKVKILPEQQMEETKATAEFWQRKITEDYLDLNEPRGFFDEINFEKTLKFKDVSTAINDSEEQEVAPKKMGNLLAMAAKKTVKIQEQDVKRTVTERPTDAGGEVDDKRRYMFSQLLADLDRLCELQLPQQEEALQEISTNLSSSRSTSATSQQDGENGAATGDSGSGDAPGTADKSLTINEMAVTSMAFPFLSGLSFLRQTEIPKEEPIEVEEEDASSSEYDEEEYNWEEELEESNICNANLRAGVQDFLRKQSKSESTGGDSCSDGKIKASNIAALTQGKWSTRDVHDTKFNEDKLSIQFRTGRLGIFGFALNRYSNMPYQTWEIKPDFKSPGTILFSFTASIVSLDITITSGGYCVNSFQGGSTDAINDMIGKTLSLADMKSILVSSAVDIFPEDDAFCYTEGSCEKNYIMEMHLYACMSTLALSHNFSWSRWNLLAGSRTAVLLLRELIEGKKVPYYSTLLVTPLKTAIIECTEVSASFNATGIPGMQYYADLYQLMKDHALPSSLEKQSTMDPVLRDNVARILMAIRPISFC